MELEFNLKEIWDEDCNKHTDTRRVYAPFYEWRQKGDL